MDLIKYASEIFISKLGSDGSGLNLDSVMSGLKKLLPTNNGELDVTALVGMFSGSGSGLAAMASSWLGDGENESLDISSVLSLLGKSKVTEFASGLGLDTEQAASGISDMVPELIDKASDGGNLVGDIGSKLASGFLGKLF